MRAFVRLKETTFMAKLTRMNSQQISVLSLKDRAVRLWVICGRDAELAITLATHNDDDQDLLPYLRQLRELYRNA